MLFAVFGICMICHGELVRHKPGVERLTAFYLTIATGGAIGGLIVAIGCPLVFSSYHELPIGLLLSFVLAVSLFFDSITAKATCMKWWHFPPLAITVLATAYVANTGWTAMESDEIISKRNFYGALHVREFGGEYPERRLVNGRILHGTQLLDEATHPTTYYSPDSGIGLVMDHHLPLQPRRVAVVGLGVGTLAAYGQEGDVIRFYEINPDVIELANDTFSYLSDSPATVETILGDARLSMENEEVQNYDVMAIDAFSSDSIPVHLMTREAIDVFLRHLKPDGILAFHVSNRYLKLIPVVESLANDAELNLLLIESEDDGDYASASSWVLLSRDPSVLEHPELVDAATFDYETLKIRMWTDQFSNLMEVLQ